jgi:hypothetical protein
MKVPNLFLFAMAITGTAGASVVYETSALAELTGSRDISVIGGVDVLNGGDLTSLFISWTIMPIAGHYHYSYELSGTTGPGLGVSHFALELSNSCTTDSTCIADATLNGSNVQGAGPEGAVPRTGIWRPRTHGVRLNQALHATPTIAFDSDGRHYANSTVKTGQQCGRGAALESATPWQQQYQHCYFIPRPDTETVNVDVSTAPEPLYSSLGVGTGSIGLVRRHHRS